MRAYRTFAELAVVALMAVVVWQDRSPASAGPPPAPLPAPGPTPKPAPPGPDPTPPASPLTLAPYPSPGHPGCWELADRSGAKLYAPDPYWLAFVINQRNQAPARRPGR